MPVVLVANGTQNLEKHTRRNGVEAIQQKREGANGGGGEDQIVMKIRNGAEKLSIEVSDTGAGLPADRGRLTEPYMTTRAKGTGLGLAIVKKIVEEHFGQIEFDDAPDGGSRVRFTFDVEALRRLAADLPPYIQVASG